jgi:transcription termination factor Rho
MSTMVQLESKNKDELEAMAKECGIAGYTTLKKSELVYRILQAEAQQQGNIFIKFPDPPLQPKRWRYCLWPG